MERVCFELRVRADRLDEYRERHRAVWPELLAALRDAMATTGVDARWQAETAELFESGKAPEFARPEEVFHLD